LSFGMRRRLVLLLPAIIALANAATETWHDPNDGTSGSYDTTGDNLAIVANAVRTFITGRKTAQDLLHKKHDDWKMYLDDNNLVAYERRNLQYANNAMQNLNAYYRELKYRNIMRNEQLYSENQAYNASVQFNEALIKYINQSEYALQRDSSFLDHQNIELMAEIGVLRDGSYENAADGTGRRTFGLTRQRQSSVQRKLLNYATYKAVEAEAHAMRAIKKSNIVDMTRLRALKNNEMVKNTGLEMHTVTLTAQRNFEQTSKLRMTWKKKNMKERKDLYTAKANTLETSRMALEEVLKDMVIENARLRELNSEYLTQRLQVKIDRDLQKHNYIEALLQRNSARTYRDKMIEQYNDAKTRRDASQTDLHTHVSTEASKFVALTDCEENNRHLERHISILKNRNAGLRNNCYGQ